MTTHRTTTTAPSPAGRCLTCGEHVPFGVGALAGPGVVHLSDQDCSDALRFLDDPCVVVWKGPSWVSAQIEPDGTSIGTPAGEW